MPKISGSANVIKMLTEDLNGAVKAKFWVEPDPKKAAAILFDHIEGKRADLGL
jgi:carbon-monoxide dehydrogenase catalytic subunit